MLIGVELSTRAADVEWEIVKGLAKLGHPFVIYREASEMCLDVRDRSIWTWWTCSKR